MYFCEIENFAYGEINERSFSNPHPRMVVPVMAPKDPMPCAGHLKYGNSQHL